MLVVSGAIRTEHSSDGSFVVVGDVDEGERDVPADADADGEHLVGGEVPALAPGVAQPFVRPVLPACDHPLVESSCNATTGGRWMTLPSTTRCAGRSTAGSIAACRPASSGSYTIECGAVTGSVWRWGQLAPHAPPSTTVVRYRSWPRVRDLDPVRVALEGRGGNHRDAVVSHH